ncbi:unnamed protein product, partial [Schistocephalus solidus]|uniref:Thyroid hormone receptor-associated protein complex subunit n=1 Tax=Schistocephalus solidus TaxID=70667 RepID=A0A183TNY8_SCHSO
YGGYSDQAVDGQFGNSGPPGYVENAGGGGGDGFEMMNDQGAGCGGSPIAAAGLDQTCGDAGLPMGHEMHHIHHQNQSLDRGISYSTGPRGGIQNSTGPLPPPSQPPPPPPAPQMGLPPPGYYVRQDSGSLMDSLNRRPTGGALGGSGLLVGPPPRIRDYSEYGIPAGIHHHAPGVGTASSASAPGPPNATGSPKPVLSQTTAMSGKPPAYNGGTPMSPGGGLQSPPFNGRYREGQA